MSQFSQLPSELTSIFSPSALRELEEKFREFDKNGDGTISLEEFTKALYNVGETIEENEIKNIMKNIDIDNSGSLSFVEFVRFVHSLRTQNKSEGGRSQYVLKRTATSFAETVLGDGGASHVIPDSERLAFSEHINNCLQSDTHASRHLPLGLEGSQDLYEKTGDGLIYCKLINLAEPGTIDERAINKKDTLNVYQKTENLNLAIQAAKRIGCQIVNIGPMDLIEGRPVLVLGLIWQIIKIQLMSQISLRHCPELALLALDGEDPSILASLSPEDLLLRWFNYHLNKAGTSRRVGNFGSDLQDSECYSILLNQLDSSKCNLCTESDLEEKADHVIRNARSLGVQTFIRADDIVSGNKKLNLGLVAQLFNTCPKLEVPPEVVLPPPITSIELDDAGDTREERVFRMWINSLNLPDTKYIHSLFEDLADGLVILALEDFVQPGVVNWKRVNKKPTSVFKKVENCNYAVDIGKQMGFRLVNIGGEDIVRKNAKLILAIVWQLMRKSTLNTLKGLASHENIVEIQEDHILEWANQRVRDGNSLLQDIPYITSFKDSTISTSLYLLNLLSIISPESINLELIHLNPSSDEEKLENAKYAISIAMKIGTTVFVTPEDIVEIKPKMIMSFISQLWVADIARKEMKLYK